MIKVEKGMREIKAVNGVPDNAGFGMHYPKH